METPSEDYVLSSGRTTLCVGVGGITINVKGLFGLRKKRWQVPSPSIRGILSARPTKGILGKVDFEVPPEIAPSGKLHVPIKKPSDLETVVTEMSRRGYNVEDETDAYHERVQKARFDRRPQVVVKTYANNRAYERHATKMVGLGYLPQSQNANGGRVTLTRVATMGLFALGAKKGKKKVTVTWIKQTPASNVESQPTPSDATIPEQIADLSKLKDQGVLTEDEFAAKKAELLARI
jgi:hypothetical protein